MSLTNTIKHYSIFAKQEYNALCILDRAGEPRWIWPKYAKQPLFLQLYQASTIRQKLFKFLVNTVFALNIQRWIFHTIQWNEAIEEHDNWAVFTGTIGPNRKQVIINGSHKNFGPTIVKRALGPQSAINLENENKVLQLLNTCAIKLPFVKPKSYAFDGSSLYMEQLDATCGENGFSYMHCKAISGLNKINIGVVSLKRWLSSVGIEEKLGSAKGDFPISFLNQLNKLYDSLNIDRQINIGMAHGDFTPWNTFMHKGKLALIDWEFARMDMPLGFDFFHFHLQSGIMLHRKQWQEIRKDINAALTPEVLNLLFKNEKEDVDFYLKLYLIYHITYHLELYSAQDKWHDQVYWQIETWSDALLSVLNEKELRKNFIHNIFSNLHYTEYAVLKAGHTHPAEMGASGDIDVVMHKKNCRKLYQKLSSNPFVKSISLQKKSYMYALRIRLVNDEWVFLDLIWQIKYKALEFMNVEHILQAAYVNQCGIKVTSDADTAYFIKYFYALNNAPVPLKYANDEMLERYFDGPLSVQELKNRPENSGWSKLKNTWHYFVDTTSMLFQSRGYIITFSGVDGAGKSTIIDEVKEHIDKVWRKPVVVLRHRPSILPILSAYVYGKKNAEAMTVNKMPRTGVNDNLFSSLLRWMYYLIDYVFGHFYIQWKYLNRGYIIIYDRYYYDFICDAKRSNIVLPKRLLTLGMKAIVKPEFNFFLYAAPEVILARKQELDGNVISELTDNYMKCFTAYKDKYNNKIFLPVENIDKSQTMHIIKSTITKII